MTTFAWLLTIVYSMMAYNDYFYKQNFFLTGIGMASLTYAYVSCMSADKIYQMSSHWLPVHKYCNFLNDCSVYVQTKSRSRNIIINHGYISS